MTIIDRYVNEIGTHLPEKQRADIQKEIKSMIDDMLAEKCRAAGSVIDHKLTLEVLKELGKPEKVAASYFPPRYLIGPQLYPIFWLVLKISLIVVLIVMILILAVRIAIGDLNTWSEIGVNISTVINVLVGTAGWVVITFFILERVTLPSKIGIKEKEWDPSEMLKKADLDKISLATPIIGIIFSIAALVIFNVFPGVIAIKNYTGSEWVVLFTPSDAFNKVLPLINTLWIFFIVFHGATMFRQRWYHWTRWSYIGLQIFSITIMAILLAGPGLVNPNSDVLNTINTTSFSSNSITNLLNQIVRVSLGIGIVVSIVEIGKNLYKIYANRNVWL